MSALFVILASVLIAMAIGILVSNLPDSWLPSYRKVGGLHHWRVGRVGGSLYIARRTR